MAYDPVWDMPQVNWQQQGSFEPGEIPPAVSPDAGTQVCIGPIAQEWLPVMLGALDQLRNPSTWIVADDDALYQTLARVDLLREIVATKLGCEVPVMTRLNNCILQTSADGGATWVNVPGWVDNFANCIRDNLPPPPPQIGPGPIEQYACNISGFLASELIQAALAKAVAEYGSSVTYIDFALWVGANTFAAALPYAYLFAEAVFNAWKALNAGNIADFRAAVTDPVLIGRVTCAIFNAIRGDGEVTDANWVTATANICAVVYAPADIIPAICDMAGKTGAANIRALQATGAYETIDCSGCGFWCHEYDMTTGAHGWATYIAPGGVQSGVGWTAQYRAADNTTSINIRVSFGFTTTIENVRVYLKTSVANIAGDFLLEGWLAGGFVAEWGWNSTNDGAVHCYPGGPSAVTCDQLYFAFEAAGNVSPAVLEAIQIGHSGVNPFGPGNCTRIGACV